MLLVLILSLLIVHSKTFSDKIFDFESRLPKWEKIYCETKKKSVVQLQVKHIYIALYLLGWRGGIIWCIVSCSIIMSLLMIHQCAAHTYTFEVVGLLVSGGAGEDHILISTNNINLLLIIKIIKRLMIFQNPGCCDKFVYLPKVS